MANQITFIHAADLHLGAPLRGLRAASPEFAGKLARAIPRAYDRLIDTAIDHEVDFVIIAGDIFDQAQPSYANFVQFMSGVQRLGDAGIPLYFLTGNHDPYVAWQAAFAEMPSNAYLFSADKPSFTVYERKGRPLALLGGRGYYNRVVSDSLDIAEGITREAAVHACGTDAPFAVGVLHTGLHLDAAKAPARPDQLLRSGFDYWALGHVHRRYVDDPSNPRLVFPGNIQGRDIHEQGARGCYEVTLTEGMPNRIAFVPLASIAWQVVDVDISSCSTLAECSDVVMRELFVLNGRAHCEEMAQRVTLTGTTPLHDVLMQPGVLDDLRAQMNAAYPIFYCDALIDRSRTPLDRATLLEEGLFPAALLHGAQMLRADSSGAVAYLQDEFLAQGMVVPTRCSRHIDELQEEAEALAIDLLRGGLHD